MDDTLMRLQRDYRVLKENLEVLLKEEKERNRSFFDELKENVKRAKEMKPLSRKPLPRNEAMAGKEIGRESTIDKSDRYTTDREAPARPARESLQVHSIAVSPTHNLLLDKVKSQNAKIEELDAEVVHLRAQNRHLLEENRLAARKHQALQAEHEAERRKFQEWLDRQERSHQVALESQQQVERLLAQVERLASENRRLTKKNVELGRQATHYKQQLERYEHEPVQPPRPAEQIDHSVGSENTLELLGLSLQDSTTQYLLRGESPPITTNKLRLAIWAVRFVTRLSRLTQRNQV